MLSLLSLANSKNNLSMSSTSPNEITYVYEFTTLFIKHIGSK